MDTSELLARYAAGERDFRGVDLTGADLSGAYLYKANLSKAKLTGADLSRAYLRANLSEADLTGADLSGAYLYEADLSGANLYVANLSKANLIRSNLNVANLSEADLTGADLTGANLDGANLTRAELTEAKINGTLLAYQKVLKETKQKNQELRDRVEILEAQLAEQQLANNLTEASNQGIKAPYKWKGFLFRSKSEIRIAEALDRAGVLFYPNSKARLSTGEGRVNKESDFLVFQSGNFGILEVDGREWHQTAADDHERDRLFKRYGIRVIERFDATRCWSEPDIVVQEFLEILSQA